MTYDDFIRAKASTQVASGFDPVAIKPHLFDCRSEGIGRWQRKW